MAIYKNTKEGLVLQQKGRETPVKKKEPTKQPLVKETADG